MKVEIELKVELKYIIILVPFNVSMSGVEIKLR